MRRRLRTPLGDQEVRANDQGTNDHGWFLRSRTTTCIYLWYSGLGSKVQFRISIQVMEISISAILRAHMSARCFATRSCRPFGQVK